MWMGFLLNILLYNFHLTIERCRFSRKMH